jgi:hypothetical protein
MDMDIKNDDILFFEANPHLKKGEGAHCSFVEYIEDHLLDAKYIYWE